MDDRTLALLGDRAAQERITERGELLPCPLCAGKADSSDFGIPRQKVGISVERLTTLKGGKDEK